MNRSFLFLVFLYSSLVFPLMAQEEYYPMVSEGKTWEIAHVGMNPNYQDKSVLQLSGDTIINGNSYIKCYQILEQGSTVQDIVYYRAMREVDKRVYCVLPGSQEENLLFNFGLQVGDSVYCKFGGTYDGGFITEHTIDESLEDIVQILKLTGVDTYVNKEGMALKRYHLSMTIKERQGDGRVVEYSGRPATWVEGIGSRNDFPLNAWYVEMVSSYSWWLTKCYDSDHVFYEVDPSSIVNADFSHPSISTIFDLQGRRLNEQPAKGVYIQDGRKYVK